MTNEQKNEIIKLHFVNKKSQNEIASITGINKVYVNKVCQAYAMMQGLGEITETTPNLTLFKNEQLSKQREIMPPVPQNWGYAPNNNSAELEYLNRRIKDLETDKTDLRKKLSDTENEFAILKKEHGLQTIDLRTIESKHQYEKDNLIAQHSLVTKPKVLDGLIDKAFSTPESTDVVIAGIFKGIGMLLNKGQAPQIEATETQQPFELHELQNDAEQGHFITEIAGMIKYLKPDEIKPLHELLAMFVTAEKSLGIMGFIHKVKESAKNYIQQKTQVETPQEIQPQ